MQNLTHRIGVKTAVALSLFTVLVVAGVGVRVFGSRYTPQNPSLEPTHERVEDFVTPSRTSTSVPSSLEHPASTTSTTTIVFVGDMLFDRYIRRMSIRHGEDHIFSCLGDLLTGADLVVGNLEGPITDNPSRSMGTAMGVRDNYVFTSPTTTASLLARYRIGPINLGNNHIGNFGIEGISQTKRYLRDAGVPYFGGLLGDEPVFRRDTLSLVSYNQFGGQSKELVASIISQEKKNGQRVIVYAHWGEEYATSSGYLHDIAQLFVEQGADAVFGSHPHVIIPPEYSNGVPVYYSLGNFIFDQYWDETVTTGLVVRVLVSKQGITTKEDRVTLMLDGRTCPSTLAPSIGE